MPNSSALRQALYGLPDDIAWKMNLTPRFAGGQNGSQQAF
jgi:hypothetical protein